MYGNVSVKAMDHGISQGSRLYVLVVPSDFSEEMVGSRSVSTVEKALSSPATLLRFGFRRLEMATTRGFSGGKEIHMIPILDSIEDHHARAAMSLVGFVEVTAT